MINLNKLEQKRKELLTNFSEEELIEYIQQLTEKYYSSMAVAWALAECFIKFREKAQPFMNESFFDEMTLKRTVRKICDSYRVDENTKNLMRNVE